MGRCWECKKATKISWHEHNSKFENTKLQKKKKRKKRSEKVKNWRGGRIFGDPRSIAKKSQKKET